MTKDEIQLLFEYDRWANARVLKSVSVLTTEQFTRDLGGSFRSVRDTFVHILAGEWIWWTYWSDSSPSVELLLELRTRRNSLFKPEALPDVAAVEQKWKQVEQQQLQFLDRLTTETLERMLPFRGTQLKLGHLMQHLANHSTYHRGQISLMMRQLNAEPIGTDFHTFLVENPR